MSIGSINMWHAFLTKVEDMVVKPNSNILIHLRLLTLYPNFLWWFLNFFISYKTYNTVCFSTSQNWVPLSVKWTHSIHLEMACSSFRIHFRLQHKLKRRLSFHQIHPRADGPLTLQQPWHFGNASHLDVTLSAASSAVHRQAPTAFKRHLLIRLWQINVLCLLCKKLQRYFLDSTLLTITKVKEAIMLYTLPRFTLPLAR